MKSQYQPILHFRYGEAKNSLDKKREVYYTCADPLYEP